MKADATFQALLEEEDRLEHRVGEAGDEGRYHLSLGLTQTPFLADSLFQVASLEITIYAAVGRRLYFYDSAGLWIDELEHIGARVGPKVLHSLTSERRLATSPMGHVWAAPGWQEESSLCSIGRNNHEFGLLATRPQ